jgi:hypothetical protein
MRALVRLLALLAVMLMPFGMVPAAASAAHHQMASMPMQHCPEQGSGHQPKTAFAVCTMACSAALPALDQSAAERLPIAREQGQPSLAQRLSDLHPEIATPPPKLS